VRTLHFAVPGALCKRTGGYRYDRRIVEGLRARGWDVCVHDLGAGFPRPTAHGLDAAEARLQHIEDGATVVMDGLALGVMPAACRRLAARVRLVALIHHPLALETGLTTQQTSQLRSSEGAALASARLVIVTSATTQSLLRGYDVAPGRVAVVRPGTDQAPRAIGGPRDTRALLCVATLTPRKGHGLLLQALARLEGLSWRLSCVGSMGHNRTTARGVREEAERLGLTKRIEFKGELDDQALADAYHHTDLFVLASYMEGYGMALAEALARGVPVVSTRVGAVPETVPPGAGLLVAPGNVVALAAALDRVIRDPDYRHSLAQGARAAGERLPSWDDSVARFESTLLATR